MSSPYADEEVRTVLGFARRLTGAAGALFLPLGPGPRVQTLGDVPAQPESLLSSDERGLLRAGELLWIPPRPAAPGSAFAPVTTYGGVTFGALGVLLPDTAENAAPPKELAELAGLLSHAIAAEAQRAEEGEYSRFFTLSLDHMAIAGFDGYFKLLNPVWEQTLGYTLEELYSRPYLDFVHPDDHEITTHEKEGLSRGAMSLTFSNRYIKKDGTLCYLQWNAAPSFERKRVYAVARDVTEAVEVARELKQSREAAEAASQAKSAFLAMMSHELRTPLNSVIGFSNMLLRDKDDTLSSEQRDFTERIRSNGLNLLGLINSILDLSRIEAGRVQPEVREVELVGLARDVVASLRPQVLDGVELEVDVPDRPATYRTDGGRLRQILLNLVGNGLKFTPSGAVTLRLLPIPEAGSTAYAFEVEDTGPGIAPEHLETVFEPFRQVDGGAARRYDGSGLGLSISRSFADALGLEIEVESRVGSGTLFRVMLPAQA